MISQLGSAAVLLALMTCAIGAPLGFFAGASRSAAGLQWTRRMALAFALFMILANLIMEYALVTRDFSVSYVASVGSLATPLHITIVSLWSSLEGSILFWGLVLGLFTAGVTLLQRRGHEDYLAYTLGTLFLIGLFFSFLIAGPANPFRPTPLPIPTDGPGPNPLLQNHILMIIHPPMLYLGYVGMSVPFAMAVAALLRGQLGASWLRALRNWLLVPTSFLTLGVMLGGWWSYEVLGWGGYWAWDPVENASFLPWLTAIAALHSAVVQQRRGTLKAWTVILVMVTFLLTILGTFLTRSGVVNSLHSFTQSPIGPLFLTFLGIALVASIILLSLRIDSLVSEPSEDAVVAREGAFLLNNLLLVTFTFTVLVGTIFPIIAEAVRGVKVSVGEPYFNRMAVPICLGLLALIGIGPALPWGRADKQALQRALVWPLPAAIVGLILALLAGGAILVGAVDRLPGRLRPLGHFRSGPAAGAPPCEERRIRWTGRSPDLPSRPAADRRLSRSFGRYRDVRGDRHLLDLQGESGGDAGAGSIGRCRWLRPDVHSAQHRARAPSDRREGNHPGRAQGQGQGNPRAEIQSLSDSEGAYRHPRRAHDTDP